MSPTEQRQLDDLVSIADEDDSPLTDFEIIMGKFLGAMALYASMLAITLIHMVLLFSYGNPEWRIVVTGYIGLLLMGGCFVSVGLLISSMTKNQIVSGMITLRISPVPTSLRTFLTYDLRAWAPSPSARTTSLTSSPTGGLRRNSR